MKDLAPKLTRRAVLHRSTQALAAIGVAVLASRSGLAHAKKKSDKEDFYFQTEPGELGRSCSGCANYEPYSGGAPKATVALLEPGVAAEKDKGTCALLIGEVCSHCYCQGWTDKKTGKKAS